MSTLYIKNEKGQVTGILTLADVYKYNGFMFEYHHFLGPTKVNKDGNPSARTGVKFYKALDAWLNLSEDEREATRAE